MGKLETFDAGRGNGLRSKELAGQRLEVLRLWATFIESVDRRLGRDQILDELCVECPRAVRDRPRAECVIDEALSRDGSGKMSLNVASYLASSSSRPLTRSPCSR